MCFEGDFAQILRFRGIFVTFQIHYLTTNQEFKLQMRRFFLIIVMAMVMGDAIGQELRRFSRGADISWVTELESRGTKFCDFEGNEMECTALMKELGLDAIRLRVWVNPERGFNGKEDVIEKARRAKRLGMDIMIDFHYSDTWADPGKQYIPASWKEHSYKEMLKDVYKHTKDVLESLKKERIEPRWVQVGNETTNGLLWPVGAVDKHPDQYAGLIKSGCKAVKKVFPKCKTIVHLDNGFDQGLYDYNLGILEKYGVNYDIIGMSLYPLAAVEYHSDKVRSAKAAIDKCIMNMDYQNRKLGKECIITEVGVKVTRPDEGYELLKYLMDKITTDCETPCRGVFYWEPEAAVGYNGGYDMGAFEKDEEGRNRPTKIIAALRAFGKASPF